MKRNADNMFDFVREVSIGNRMSRQLKQVQSQVLLESLFVFLVMVFLKIELLHQIIVAKYQVVVNLRVIIMASLVSAIWATVAVSHEYLPFRITRFYQSSFFFLQLKVQM